MAGATTLFFEVCTFREGKPMLCLRALLAAAPSSPQFSYPPTRTVNASDSYFGKSYKDSYRWLEDLQQPEVASWFKAQAGLTDDLIGRIPARDKLVEEWMTLDRLQPARYRNIA